MSRLLRVRNLECTFGESLPFWKLGRAPQSPAGRSGLRDVSLDLDFGETLAVLGASGSGKSTLARCIAGLSKGQRGEILLAVPRAPGRVQMIFQDPAGSLNPSMRVGRILSEPMELCFRRRISSTEIAALLSRVGLPASASTCLPHDFSGGEQQRIAIARAISTRPVLLLCDEITSALDVSTQAQILQLLADCRKDFGMSCLIFSHDLGVVAQLAHRIAILADGTICESGTTEEILRSPAHDYTRALIAAATPRRD